MGVEYFADIKRFLSYYVGSTTASYAVAFLILIVSLALAKIVNFIFSKVLFRIAVRKSGEAENHIVAVLNAPIFYSIVLAGLYESLIYIKILSRYSLTFSQILKSVAVILWAVAISKISHILIMKIAERSRGGSRGEMIPLFKNISSVIVWFLGAMLVLHIWHLNIMPLLASAGIAGFVIAFGAQDTISQLISGVMIYSDKPFRVGDRIQLDSGDVGDVLDIGIRTTRIKTLDDTVIIVPNKTIASSRIINYNKPKSKIKVKLSLTLARATDINKAKKAILNILGNIEEIETDPAPAVYFTEATDSGVKFQAVAWAGNPKKQFEVKTIMVDKLYAGLIKDKFAVSSLMEDTGKK